MLEVRSDTKYNWRYVFITSLKSNWREGVNIVLSVMALAALVIAINSNGRANRAIDQSLASDKLLTEYIACKADYDDKVNQRTQALTLAAEKERVSGAILKNATSRLFTAPELSIPSEERTKKQQDEVLRLFREYQAALKNDDQARIEANKERAAHPVPEAPSKVCGLPPTKTPGKPD